MPKSALASQPADAAKPAAALLDTLSAPPAANAVGADRRQHRRHPLAEIPSINKVRLKYGPAVALIDISNGGAQIETTNFRMQPGSTVVVEISAAHGDVAIPANVLRCQLASLLPEPVYRGALVFKQTFDVRQLGVTETPDGADADSEPEATDLDAALELEKLRAVLVRVTFGPGRAAPDGVHAALSSALDAALAVLNSSAGQRAGAALAEEMAEMFQAVAAAFERTPTAMALMMAIEEHLRHVVPARAIRLAHPDTYMQTPGAEAILLTIPRLSPEAPAARLAVEFPDGCEPQELHFLILKAGIHLVAVASELGRLIGPHTPISVRTSAPADPRTREVA